MQHIAPTDLSTKLAAGDRVHLIDVRQPWEHALAAIPGCVLIPLDELPRRASEIPNDGTLVVTYCHHGMRSQRAAQALEQLGFQGVASLTGGIDAWAQQCAPDMARY